jgi:hypothetical protein
MTRKAQLPRTYQVVAEREPGWWIITIPGLDITTQARRLSQVEHNAATAIAVWLDIDLADVSVTVEVSTPGGAEL